MKCLKRNKVRFFYALFTETEMIETEQGYLIGEIEVKHSDPVECFANISAAVGETITRQFGDDVVYDKVIVMDNEAPAIDEYSILWVDQMPELDETGALAVDAKGEILTPHDYVVKKVGRSLNQVAFAVSKVNVT